MHDFLLQVWRGSGVSVPFVTNRIDEAVALGDRVMVFSARPGTFRSVVPVALPKPRDSFAREVERLRIDLPELYRDEVDCAFAEQKGLAAIA